MEAPLLLKPDVNPQIPSFGPGDTVRVHFRIREGDRERVQAFQGVVIRRQHGNSTGANFTVRRVTASVGIERTFPFHSPLLESLEVVRHGAVRRAKLYYLRGLQGRAARIKEKTVLRRQPEQPDTEAYLSSSPPSENESPAVTPSQEETS